MTINFHAFYDEFGYNNLKIIYSNRRGRTIIKEFYLKSFSNGKRKIKLNVNINDEKGKHMKNIREYEYLSTAKKGLWRETKKYLLKTHLRYHQSVQIGKTILENPEQIKEYFGLEKKVVTEPLPHSQSQTQEKSEQRCP